MARNWIGNVALAALATQLTWAADPTPQPSPTASLQVIEFDRAEGGTLHFRLPSGSKAISSLKAEIHDVKYLGAIRPEEGGLPYFVLTGRPCADCIQDAKVYFVRPQAAKPVSMVYPGKIFDSKSRALLLESRAFYGRCLFQNKDDVYVVFQRERVDRRHRMQSSVFIAEFGKDKIEEKLLERNLPTIHDTLKLVRRKTCHEIDTRNRLMLKKAFEFKKPVKDDDDDDEDRPDIDDDEKPAAGSSSESTTPAGASDKPASGKPAGDPPAAREVKSRR